jgi:hypothetical protein
MKHENPVEMELLAIAARVEKFNLNGTVLIEELSKLVSFLPGSATAIRQKIAKGRIDGKVFYDSETKCGCAYGWFGQIAEKLQGPDSYSRKQACRLRWDSTRLRPDIGYGDYTELETFVHPVCSGETAATNERLQLLDDALAILERGV